MNKVYFKKLDNLDNKEIINNITYEMISNIVKDANIKFQGEVPLKVHFGEDGNDTFIKPVYFDGIKKYLKDNNHATCYIETNVLYKGSRTYTKDHINTALKHGFDDLEIVIADGDDDHPYNEIEVNLKHFKTCKIGTKFADYKNYIVIAHFKGHGMAGFGGALKQLAMGFAARGGKLHQHTDSIPIITEDLCVSCGRCVAKCPVDAISLPKKAVIDPNICVGCASCSTVCPVNAISNNWDASNFTEKLAEYAYAAQKDNTIIYINFVLNITSDCDCVGEHMDFISPNIGIMASFDPVALDQACYDKVKAEIDTDEYRQIEKTLEYAEKINIGSRSYELIEL